MTFSSSGIEMVNFTSSVFGSGPSRSLLAVALTATILAGRTTVGTAAEPCPCSPSRAPQTLRSLSPAEFERLCSELPAHLADMARFSVATGLRQANVKGLEWRYVDLGRQHAWIPGSQHKNGKPHSVPLNEMALSVLRRQVGKHPTMVFTYVGQPVANVYTKAFKAALERAGIEDFKWHDLRHTFATWHRQAGTPTHELQRLGGWKTAEMVERYAHIAPEQLQGAAARLDAFASYETATPERKTA